MLADLGFSFFGRCSCNYFHGYRRPSCFFFLLHFLLVPAPMETPCALIVHSVLFPEKHLVSTM